jgi:hypothetical protein
VSVFDKVLVTDSFLSWLQKYNLWADASNPAGTGTVEFANVAVSGMVTFGSSAMLGLKTVQSYDLDPVYTPRVVTNLNRACSEFTDGFNRGIWFAFDMSEFRILSTTRKIVFGYSTSATGTGNSYWKYSYWVNAPGRYAVALADGTGYTAAEVTGTAGSYRTMYAATLPVSGISDSSYSVLVKLERLGANALDTCSSTIYLYDLKVE